MDIELADVPKSEFEGVFAAIKPRPLFREY
ncbi:hypothetical protein J2Y64_000353 [Aeromonas salmonicida]|nr:hypothetical protein [Aeromonas salmonicida]